MAKRDGWVRKQTGPGTAVPLLCGRSGEGMGVPQRGVHTGHVVQWAGSGPGSPRPSCPSPFGYATSSYPGLGARLAGSELKRHMLWPQGALGLVARGSAVRKGYWSACPGPQVSMSCCRGPANTRPSCWMPRWVISLRGEL